jgi:hypothetical protein
LEEYSNVDLQRIEKHLKSQQVLEIHANIFYPIKNKRFSTATMKEADKTPTPPTKVLKLHYSHALRLYFGGMIVIFFNKPRIYFKQ